MELRLAASGIEVGAQQRLGKYVSVDPSDKMDKFIIEGRPDKSLFRDLLGNCVAQATRKFGGVRIFSEMVAVLLDHGNAPLARELEGLWNDLAKTHSFTLFCAYPLHKRSSDTAGKILIAL